MQLLDRIEQDLNTLISGPYPSEPEAADWAGRLAAISKKANDYKRGLLAEMPGPVRGSSYQVTESRSATRSYNSAAIIHAFDQVDWTLHDLIRRDAVRLAWRWTELKAAFAEADLVMQLAPREIEDLGSIDPPHVGEYWKAQMSVEGISE